MKFETPPEAVESLEGSAKYEVNGEPVNVAWRIFEPKRKKENGVTPEGEATKKGVVFLPGWSINERAKAIELLCDEFANYSESPAYAIDARTDNVVANSTEIQAEAIRRFIEERGLQDVTLVGNSLGGVEAIHLTALLQGDAADTNIEGLVLLDSLSLYDQMVPELGLNYVKDMANTQKSVRGISKKRAAAGGHVKRSTAEVLADQNKKYLNDGTAEVLKELLNYGFEYPKRMASELRQMTTKNSHLKDIRVPVVMVQGKGDQLSNPYRIIPEGRERESMRAREEFLKENVFTNAPHVAMIIPEKLGNHNLPYARSEEVARSSLYMLKRLNREKKED